MATRFVSPSKVYCACVSALMEYIERDFTTYLVQRLCLCKGTRTQLYKKNPEWAGLLMDRLTVSKALLQSSDKIGFRFGLQFMD